MTAGNIEDDPQLASEAATDTHGWNAGAQPLRRYGARMIDVQLFGGIAIILVAFLIGFFTESAMFLWIVDEARWKSMLVYGPLMWLLAAPVIAMSLAATGTTPGKWLFGLRVRRTNAEPLDLARSMKREGLLLVFGIGFAIPLLSLFTLVTSLVAVQEGRATRWDDRSHTVVEARPASGWQMVGVVVGAVVVIAILTWSAIERVVAAV